MPSKVYWVEKPWIMSADYEGRLTVQDFDDVMRVCLEALEHQPVYFVVDLSKISTYPLAAPKISSMMKMRSHPNTAAFAWVGANRISRVLISKMIFKPMGFFDRRPDAIAYLRQRVAAERTEGETAGKSSGAS
jgi:hypothetical protein